jgi:nitric oxide reductase activation protein
MSGSTGEAIARPADASGLQDVGALIDRTQRRIIDVEREAIVLMSDALEAIGDRYGVYGFSGHGRDNVEFYVIKDLNEDFGAEVAKRFGRIGPLHATRMGPAIRHTTMKLRQEQSRAKFLFLISDGRPQDRGYSQESSEKAYAVQDTRMALIEARREGIHPFCLTVDKEGNDYLRTMMDDFSYEVLADVSLLPLRLPQLYRKLTM